MSVLASTYCTLKNAFCCRDVESVLLSLCALLRYSHCIWMTSKKNSWETGILHTAWTVLRHACLFSSESKSCTPTQGKKENRDLLAAVHLCLLSGSNLCRVCWGFNGELLRGRRWIWQLKPQIGTEYLISASGESFSVILSVYSSGFKFQSLK